ncbi:MAG TPA: hypothetical protein DDW50_08730, partial [Firmicutes bacterium]|nr:hypothetical protein [Bacillota bacterium]
IGLISTIHFFWAMVAWISQNDVKVREKGVRGPKIVVIGGGTGLGTILRGLKEITPNLTAIVTVADDGGSSGRLRREFGILPPGDIRNCLVAMANLEPLMERLMQYRFQGETNLAGHSFGNLFLTVMTEITGDFEAAIRESSKVLAVRGQVLPATLEDVVLKAELIDGTIITGESKISKSKQPIKRVFFDPNHIQTLPEAVNAINEADVVILGPGSLYTSIIPNLLVKDITAAIKRSKAVKIYICNAMTQPGETDHYSASDHIQAIINHAGTGLIDVAITNTEEVPPEILKRYIEEGAEAVLADLDKIGELGITPLGRKIIVKSKVIRHDATKLAHLIAGLSRTHQFGSSFGGFLNKKIYRFFKPDFTK